MGGTRRLDANRPSSLLVVCGSATTGCHQIIESHRAWAVASGWLVPSGHDPAMVAVLICHVRRVYLTDAATYSDEPPREAA